MFFESRINAEAYSIKLAYAIAINLSDRGEGDDTDNGNGTIITHKCRDIPISTVMIMLSAGRGHNNVHAVVTLLYNARPRATTLFSN